MHLHAISRFEEMDWDIPLVIRFYQSTFTPLTPTTQENTNLTVHISYNRVDGDDDPEAHIHSFIPILSWLLSYLDLITLGPKSCHKSK